MLIVVSYDIPDDKRRTRVMKTLKDFGSHVQYSVFECNLRQEDYQKLRSRLRELVNLEEDNIRFYILSLKDFKKRRVWGVERTEVGIRPWYLVGGGIRKQK